MDNPNGEEIEMDDLDGREESNEESPTNERSPILERNESSVSDHAGDTPSDASPNTEGNSESYLVEAKVEEIERKLQANSDDNTDDNTNDQVWDNEEHTELLAADAHGEISFDQYSTTAKYVRCAEDTEPRVIWELLTAYWGLDPPNLLISIAGSEMTNVEQKLRFAFQEALVETAFATKAWIFTDGMNGGASKLVGEAVRKFRRNGYQIALIGIASWGWVRNKEQLIGGNGNPVHYSFDHTSVEDSAPLDCNHTHFLLVDNGTQNQVNVEVTFRDELETFISAIDKYTLNTKIDILCDNLDQIKAKIRNAPCEEGQLENNPLLEFAKHVLFQHPRFGTLRIETEPQEEYCESYEDLEKIISKYKDDQEIFYKTLKKAIVNELDQINLGVNLNGEIDVLKDEVPQLKDKVNRITCVDELLSFVEHTVFPRLGEQGFIIDTNERNRLYIGSYEELKEKIKNKTVLADDLKQAVVKVLDRLSPKGITFYIPAVQILVAGEPGTLKTAKKAVESSKPIIVVKGTGGAADLLTYACTTEYDVDSVNFELQLQRKLAMSGWLPDDHLQSLAYCANQREGFTIYNQQSSGSLNMAIAQAVKSVKKVDQKEDKDLVQKMALIWSKVDLDSEDLFTGNDQSQLTRLVFLVRKQEMPNRVYRICNGDNRDANKIIRIVMGDTDTDLAKDNPEFILFIWSLLMLKVDLASLFFGNCQNPVATSLIAVTILNDMDKHVEDSEEKETIKALVKHYKDASVGVLNTCYSVNKENTHLMLINSLSKMGTTNTCIELSVSAKHKEFISQPGCQTLFDNAWNGEKTQEFIKKGKESKCSTCCKCGKCSTLNRMEWPICKFYVNYLFTFSFLILYSIILLTRFNPVPDIDPFEYLLMVWIFALFCEEILLVVTLKWSQYIHDRWNVLHGITLCLYLPGFILRFIPQSTCSRCFEFAVYILAIDLMLFVLQMLHMFAMFKTLGPKLVMIRRMMKDLLQFLLILVVFVTAYGLAQQAIMCQEKLGWNLLIDVFYKAYWQIFGRLFPDDLDDIPYVYDSIGNRNKTDLMYNDTNITYMKTDPIYDDAMRNNCPQRNLDSITVKDVVLQVLLAAYFLITYLLMLNLLIAMFSYTFAKIQEESDKTWKYQRYFLLREFITKPPVPSPFNLLYLIYLMFKGCAKCCGYCSRKSDEDEHRILAKWEKINAENYIRNQFSKKKLEIDERNKETSDRVYHLEKQIGELREMHTQIGQSNQEQIKTVSPTQSTDYTVEKVEKYSVKEFRAPGEIRLGYPASMNPLTDDAIIVCAQMKPQFTVVKIFGKNTLQHICKTYRLPEGNYIRSGVLIREHHCNGKTHALYMFIVGHVGEYRVCTVVLKSGTPILKAGFEIRYEPIHAFYIDKSNFGVLCRSSDMNSSSNIISVYSKNDLENPPDIYIENLHHNTLWSGRGRIIDLPGSDGGGNNTISVTSDGHFCLGVYQKGNILIYNAGGMCLTTLKISDVMSGPHSLICIEQNNILVVGKKGHVNLYQPNWERITEEKGRGEWVEVRGALVDKKNEITLMTCHSVVSGNYMWSVELVIKDNDMCLRAYTIQRAGKESESEGTI